MRFPAWPRTGGKDMTVQTFDEMKRIRPDLSKSIRGAVALTACLIRSDRSGFRRFTHAGVLMLTTVAFWLHLMTAAAPAQAQETEDFYRQNCFSCHTIGGGPLVGPDLKDVAQRKDREWLIRFILNPQAMIDGGDPYALKIFEESRNQLMPTVPGITRDRAERLLDLIDEESQLEESQFVGLQISDRPFTDADVALGEQLFLGQVPLKNGGPACIGCHTVRELGGLSGGRLGPDLTKVYERVGGRNPMTAWLYAPATPGMSSVFADHAMDSDEILALTAYFERVVTLEGEDDSNARLNFFLIGLGGAVFVLALFDGMWRRRFRAVRRPMIEDRLARTTPS